ncbi:OmpA family protein [Suttonella sp. R2A3]|uniref:OmpA family protein n=1 Tax=Suttonella sp. R2A3 TaxID=2908648 RepID=UPI001F387BAE|nr:OmpA family protein [Suttonella sp. R2A3]UJF24865.1 OmpA family protein [Suttonella sp. R2A3]
MRYPILVAGAAALTLAGCQTLSQNQNAAIGTGIGALVGGVAGHQVNDDNGRYVGAAVGALAGGLIGNYMDRQEQQLQQQMQGSGVGVNRVDQGTLQLNIPSEVLFGVDQSQITQAFYPTLNQIAQTLQQYPNTIVHVYGFTDGSGSEQHNLQLSQKRAQNAAQYLVAQGVNSQRFVVQGYGERFATAQNNPQERRVEVFIKAIDEANPQAAYSPVY